MSEMHWLTFYYPTTKHLSNGIITSVILSCDVSFQASKGIFLFVCFEFHYFLWIYYIFDVCLNKVKENLLANLIIN